MDKKQKFTIFAVAVFVAVFNIAFYLFGGTDHVAAVWTSYIFLHIASFGLVLSTFISCEGNNSHIFQLTTDAIAVIYFAAEFVLSMLFMIIYGITEGDSYRFVLIVHIIVTAVFVVILAANSLANKHSADNDRIRSREIFYIKNAAAKVKSMIGKNQNPAIDKTLSELYDNLYSSPTRSIPEVAKLEEMIFRAIVELEQQSFTNNSNAVVNLAAQINSLVEERNRILKTHN
ncbi:MAG: hypothetical protein E7652_04520 [Ruminococcaceae bacterium]|nr:hypothetical protein [Oscillospiraceae bacterium]